MCDIHNTHSNAVVYSQTVCAKPHFPWFLITYVRTMSGGLLGFPARCGKITEPCLLGLIGLHTSTNMNPIVLLLENVNMLVFLTQNLD